MKYFTFASLKKSYTYGIGLFIALFVFSQLLVSVSFALTIAPVRIEAAGDPGQSLLGEMKLLNEGDTERTFYSFIQNFESRGETGAPYFIDERTGLATWVEIEEKITLAPREERTLPFTINIPENAEPGGYFSAILWGTNPPQIDGAGQVAVGYRLGTLILLSVTGEVEEGGGLTYFGIKNGSRIINVLPVTFIYRFNNEGGNRVNPVGEIQIINILGMRIATLDANRTGGNILPRSLRQFEVDWVKRGQARGDDVSFPSEEFKNNFFSIARHQWNDFAFGFYNAKLNLAHTNLMTNETQQFFTNYRFFVFPWQLLIIILLALTFIGLMGFIIIKKYNRWIIAQAVKIQASANQNNKE